MNKLTKLNDDLLITSVDLKKRVEEWNIRFPVDRWWREKHGIPFGSKDHRESSFIDQLFEFYEDELYIDIRSKKNTKSDNYVPGSGSIFKSNIGSRTSDEWDEVYDNMNLDSIKET